MKYFSCTKCEGVFLNYIRAWNTTEMNLICNEKKRTSNITIFLSHIEIYICIGRVKGNEVMIIQEIISSNI